jgi:polysaccharide biosynthesis transport protein
MSDGLVPASGRRQFAPAPQDEWQDGGSPSPGNPAKRPLERPLAAIRRYKWLMIAVVILATVGGIVGVRFITPQYEVRATVWIQSETPQDNQGRVGPIRSNELLSSSAWVELLKSFRIVDAVVRKHNLYLTPENYEDRPIFRGFQLDNRYAAGEFRIELDPDAGRWSLRTEAGPVLQTGKEADSIGRSLGFKWVLPKGTLSGKKRAVEFTVRTPRETAVELNKALGTRLVERSNFLWLTYQNRDRDLAEEVLNTWVNEYVSLAGQLKKKNMVEYATILEGQLQFAQSSLNEAERALENFRVHTITLPAEGGPVAAGVEMSRAPALKSFFDQKIEFDNLKHDREALEKTIEGAGKGTMPYEGMLLIPSVSQSPGAAALRKAFDQRYTILAELATAQQTFQPEHQLVRDLSGRLATVQEQTIPNLANDLLIQLKQREADYAARVAGASKEMQSVPPRTIEEMRLRRAVIVAEGLYTTLKARYAEAKLAEAGAASDLNVMDSAVAPLKPTKNTKPSILLFAFAAGIAGAIGLAILLDAVDPKFRYPEQATQELGLPIAGAVPRLPKHGVDRGSPEQVVQLVESFRSLRMHVRHSLSDPAMFAVSSAAPGDGKSLVSANLAMSFAESGLRTVLVDGDTRRGALHTAFGEGASPGLTEYLAGNCEVADIVRQTSQPALSLVSCGPRNIRSPEMLTTTRLAQLVESLSKSFDVVIFDTPPLAAGIDAYAIAAATGNLLLVVRIGQTERRLTAAKLSIVDRLPVTIIGTVLNGVHTKGEFEYYGYTSGYSIEEKPNEIAATTA